ncbi:MAG: metalloregulator ArsR/SmtB family transcription factor [Glaciihabitans sp.]|jgi:ArsR family transcriptional regulator|nr:metalloregulator ArsR/SmtB family transcription factor [Glaciihabitans sp.]
MADIFDVISDATRRELLRHLLDRYVSRDSDSGELSVTELVEQLRISQPTVSKHLKVLRDHGLVNVRDEGQHRYYSLEASPLEELEDWLIPFLSADFDPTRIDPDDADGTTAFAAWSGAEVGQKVGRAVAERSHRTRESLRGTQHSLGRLFRRLGGR